MYDVQFSTHKDQLMDFLRVLAQVMYLDGSEFLLCLQLSPVHIGSFPLAVSLNVIYDICKQRCERVCSHQKSQIKFLMDFCSESLKFNFGNILILYVCLSRVQHPEAELFLNRLLSWQVRLPYSRYSECTADEIVTLSRNSTFRYF